MIPVCVLDDGESDPSRSFYDFRVKFLFRRDVTKQNQIDENETK